MPPRWRSRSTRSPDRSRQRQLDGVTEPPPSRTVGRGVAVTAAVGAGPSLPRPEEIQLSSRVEVTARITGPTNRPMMPSQRSPPITPQADDAEPEEPADHPGNDEQQREIGALLDEQRPQDVVDDLGEDRHHHKDRPARRRSGRVQPDDARDHAEERAELGDAEQEDDGAEDGGEGDTDGDQPDPRDRGLHDGGDDDSEGDRADGAPRQDHDRVAARSREPPEEAPQLSGRRFAFGVEDRRDRDREQEVEDQASEASSLGREPRQRRPQVRRQARGQFLWSESRQREPAVRQLLADDGQAVQPRRGWRQPQRRQLLGELHDPIGLSEDRRHRQIERDEQDEEQRRRHHRHGRAPAAGEAPLQPEHERPGRDDDHCRPEERAKERPQHPEAARDQKADSQDGQRDAREVAGRNHRRGWHELISETGTRCDSPQVCGACPSFGSSGRFRAAQPNRKMVAAIRPIETPHSNALGEYGCGANGIGPFRSIANTTTFARSRTTPPQASSAPQNSAFGFSRSFAALSSARGKTPPSRISAANRIALGPVNAAPSWPRTTRSPTRTASNTSSAQNPSLPSEASCGMRSARPQAFAIHISTRMTREMPAAMDERKNQTGITGDHQAGSSLSGMSRNSEPSELWCMVERVTAAIASMIGTGSSPGFGRNAQASMPKTAKASPA